MNHELQVSSVSNPHSFNQDGMRVVFQPGQFLQAQKPIKLNKNAFICIGLTQMLIGVTCFALNIGLFFTWIGLGFIGYGIWGGIFFFISGLLALLTGKKSTSKCLIVSTMVMDIFSAIATVPVLILSLMEFLFYNNQIKIGICSTIAALAIVEAIISITCSALCCKAYCCCSTADNVVVMYGYPGNISNSNESGYQALMFPPQLSQPPPFPQQPISSQNNGFQMNHPPPYDSTEKY